MPLVSVIVPVYKAEAYLHKCVDSLLAQTMTDFEVLLIDDGSPDHSGAICDEYAAKDSRIRVFHKENGGVSSARNLGLNNALGEYIMFVDSDDWVDFDMLFCMNKEIICSKADIVACDFVKESLNNRCVLKYAYDEEIKGDKLLKLYLDNHYISSCGKIINKSLFQNYNIEYNESIDYAEDSLIMIKLRYFSKKTRVIHQSLYHYNRLNEDSACANFNEKHQSDYINVVGLLNEFFKQEGVIEKYRLVINYLKFVSKQNILRQKKDLKMWKSIYPECHKDIFKFTSFSFVGRCKWWCCAYLPMFIVRKFIR